MALEKLNDDTFRHICRLIRSGWTLKRACGRVPISKDTFLGRVRDNPRWKASYESAKNWRKKTATEKILAIKNEAQTKLEEHMAGVDAGDINLKGSDWVKLASIGETAPGNQINIQSNTYNMAPVTNVVFHDKGDVEKREQAITDQMQKQLIMDADYESVPRGE